MSQGTSGSDDWDEKYLKFRGFFIRRARRALWTVKNKITPSQVLRLVDHPGRAQAYLVREVSLNITKYMFTVGSQRS